MKAVIKTDQIQCYDADGRLMDCAGSGQDGEMRWGANGPFPALSSEKPYPLIDSAI